MILEILLGNYEENFKFARDLANVLPLNHPKRKQAEKAVDEIQQLISKVKNDKGTSS
jgi:hypothetical protein